MKIEHVAMYVNDLNKAKAFFEKYFGAVSNDGYHNEKTGFRSFFLTFDDGARLEIMNKPGMTDDEKGMAVGSNLKWRSIRRNMAEERITA